MNAKDAAAEVLRQAGRPLHYREITERILEQGLWATTGKTPAATVNAQLAVDIKTLGPASRFVRAGRGQFALNPNATPDQPPAESPPPTGPAKEGSEAGRLSFLDSAEQVLRESGSREPLHYRSITEQALQQGLIRSEGRTPEATMYAGILTEIRRRETRGEPPRFVKHGRGKVGLAAWQPTGITRLIEDNNREVRQTLLDRARAVPPAEFESLVAELLAAIGFEDTNVTSTSKDGGIDVRGTLLAAGAVHIRMAVQAKRWKHNIQAPVVQQVRGSLGAHEQGLIITTSDFSNGAKTEATRPDAAPVALINGQQLAALLAEHQIGAQTTTHDLHTLHDTTNTDP